MRSAFPAIPRPRTQPVPAVPLVTEPLPLDPSPVVLLPVVPFPVVPFPVVPVLDVVPILDVVPTPDAQALPISPAPPAVPPDATLIALEIPAATLMPAVETTPPTVLLVDEDAAMRKLLAMLLHREGYAVCHAADSDQATAALSVNEVDVIVANLSDDEEPVVIGKWLSAYPDLSVIALSSGTETNVSLNGTSEHNLLTLPLPSRPRTVVQAVRTLLDRSRMEPARIGPSRATRCARPLFAHTPHTAIGSLP